MHVVTGFCVYLVGISIEIAIHDVYLNEPILHAHDTILGLSCGCITLCLNLMRATHKGGYKDGGLLIQYDLGECCKLQYFCILH